MLLAKVKDNECITFPYTIDNLKADNPNTRYNLFRKTLKEWFDLTEDYENGYRLVEVINETDLIENRPDEYLLTPATIPVLKEDGITWALIDVLEFEGERDYDPTGRACKDWATAEDDPREMDPSPE